MIQQVNLYQDSLKPTDTKWHTGLLAYFFIAVFILLTAYSLYLWFELDNSQNAIQSIQQELQQSNQNIQKLRQQYPVQHINPLLANELIRAEQQLNSLSDLNQQLFDKQSDQIRGFGIYFTSMARQNTPDVWLSRVTINSRKQIIKLHGSTYQPEKIGLFLQALRQEAVFKGKSFATLLLSQDKQLPEQINFIINTIDESLETDHHADNAERKI